MIKLRTDPKQFLIDEVNAGVWMSGDSLNAAIYDAACAHALLQAIDGWWDTEVTRLIQERAEQILTTLLNGTPS